MPTKGLRKSFRLAVALVLAATLTLTAEHAFARGGAVGGKSGGHFIGGSHFGRAHFGLRLRRNPAFIAPYGWGWDWPYLDYGEAPSAAATSIVAYPPPLLSAHAADNCRWNSDTFNVPSSAGGKRAVEVVSCR